MKKEKRNLIDEKNKAEYIKFVYSGGWLLNFCVHNGYSLCQTNEPIDCGRTEQHLLDLKYNTELSIDELDQLATATGVDWRDD